VDSGTYQSPLETLVILGTCCGVPLLVVVAIIWAYRRAASRRPLVLATPPDPSWLRRPQPGEIWWAHVHYDNGNESKHRPCLVIRTHAYHMEVLKITSQDKSHRWDHIEMPQTRAWDKRAKRNSYMDLSTPYQLYDSAFTHKAGVVDQWTWNEVCERHSTGWVVAQRSLS
jgi:hypothetical protein